MNRHRDTIVASCEVFRHEIELITSQMENPPSVYFMEMGLHERPDRLRETIQSFVLEQEAKRQDAFTILLAYGLCGQGLTEIICTKATLVLAKVHDCIPLLLGINQNEAAEHSLNGQTYWQSPGWVTYAHSELLRNKEAKYQEYLEKYGEDNAQYLMEEQLGWLRHYQTVKLIKWPQIAQMETKAEKSSGFFEDEARCFAREAELPYNDCTGSDTYLRALLEGGKDPALFLHIKPGSTAQLDADGAIVTVELQPMLVEIKVTNSKGEHLIKAEAGVAISKALRDHQLLELPCGGSGTCGKCLIYTDTKPSDEELKRLSPAAIKSGLRLACYTLAEKNLSISIPQQAKTKVLTAFASTTYEFSPLIELKEFAIKQSTLENQKTDIQNLLESCNADSYQLNLTQQAGLPNFLRSNETGFALLKEGVVHGFRSTCPHTLLAIDIGTTTVAAMIMDLNTETVLEVYGEHNDQGVFGADVISRIEHSISGGPAAIKQLQSTIVEQINRLKDTLISMLSANDLEIFDPNIIAITGNTSMIHFLCGLPAEHIGKAPFIPVTLDSIEGHSSEFQIESQAPVYIMPGISAYVGADIVASLLAADAHKQKEPFILVDFGTNAEIVLGDGDTYYACSTAAGPCFEGATLSCGTVAKPGAVDTIFKTEDGFSYTTIDNGQPVGICGSAVIDCISLLLKSGDLDETGRLEGGGELSDFISLGEDGHTLFSITKDVFLSQEDIRKIQLAKAAVRAGIEILLKDSGIAPEKISNLFLAGGFGNALNPESAVRIGLVPAQLGGVIRVLGNAAGCGVIRYATEKGARSIAEHIKARTQYLELSVHSDFTNEYIDQMIFPQVERMAELT